MRVHIRPTQKNDLENLFAIQREPEGIRLAGVPSRNATEFYAHWDGIFADASAIAMTILADGEVAGNIGCWEQDGKRMIGYRLAQRFWNQGIATQSLRQLISRVEPRPLYAIVAAHNVGSIRVLEKCGFVRYEPNDRDSDHKSDERYLPEGEAAELDYWLVQ